MIYDTQVLRRLLIEQNTNIFSFGIDQETSSFIRIVYESTIDWHSRGQWLITGDGKPTVDMILKIRSIYKNHKTYSELSEEQRTIVELML